jgi:hypothetical protein
VMTSFPSDGLSSTAFISLADPEGHPDRNPAV